jgi:hypothetical protein
MTKHLRALNGHWYYRLRKGGAHVEDSKGQCFVMQPFDHDRYDKLYKQVFAPAIGKALLDPYRVDNDPAASIPIETIQERIANSVACFAEITEDNPNVWFELGFAISRQKPLCLVCSDKRVHFPFDVQHRNIITYPVNSLPEDFAELQKKITERLTAVVSKDETHRQNAEMVSKLSVVAETKGLAPHELLALTLVFEEQYTSGINFWTLAENMRKAGYLKVASSLAVSQLQSKEMIEVRRVAFENYDDNQFFATSTGEEWLLSNQNELNLKIHRTPNVDDLVQSTDITDDDIPF